MKTSFVVAVAILQIPAAGAGAQERTFTLEALRDSATANDPRARQLSLFARQSELRQRTIAGELLPSIALESQAQYQSDVPRVPVPGAPALPHDTYDARVVLNQRVFDPSIDARRDVERAQLAHSRATVETALYDTRARVNDAYFGVLRAQVQGDELQADLSAIESPVAVAAARVREGA
ncbi:MAG: TolC family protein, partial [Gemmatimonadaceae bacterium]